MGRKPIGTKAMSATERQREMTARKLTKIRETNDDEWTDAECLIVLSWKKVFPPTSPLAKGAWVQLGKLRGFIES